MTQAFQANPPPLSLDDDGVIRVAGTRVTLEVIVTAFDAGATAEEIAQQFPSVDLASVYAVIAYVLHDRASVDEYVQKRCDEGAAIKEKIEQAMPAGGIRARLLARQSAKPSA